MSPAQKKSTKKQKHNKREAASPTVSVIIPAYNAEQCIGRAIESVLAQSFADYEIIVVDDGSTDTTARAVKKYKTKVNYIFQDNAGVSVARNTAINAAKGKWIAFLDADDQWLPEKLRLQMELLDRNPQLRWCGANYYRAIDDRKAPVYDPHAVREALGGRDYVENFFRLAGQIRFGVETQTAVVRKDLFDELGGFEPGRLRAQDLDVWWRIAHKYPQVGYIPEPLAIMHLDVADPVMVARRLESKRGKDIRQLMARHLKLAIEYGDLDDFTAFARREIRRRLLPMLYNGFGTDARETVTQFRGLFPWHWRLATYVLTLWPAATAALAKAAAYLSYVCRLDRQVTRRWAYRKHQTQKDSVPPKNPDKND